jgi:hypothetical protein
VLDSDFFRQESLSAFYAEKSNIKQLYFLTQLKFFTMTQRLNIFKEYKIFISSYCTKKFLRYYVFRLRIVAIIREIIESVGKNCSFQ